jgi:excisionase family DNA binding protein
MSYENRPGVERETKGGEKATPGSRLPTLVDIPTLAKHLGDTERHIRRLVAEHRIPFVKVGYLVRFDCDEIRRWLEECAVEEGAPTAPRRVRRRSTLRPLSASSG